MHANDVITTKISCQEDTAQADSAFFVPAPKELGKIYSKFSSLTNQHETATFFQRELLAVGGGVIVFIIGIWLTNSYEPFSNLPVPMVFTTLLSLFVGVSIWFDTGTDQYCEYVGQKGLAQFRKSGFSNQIKTRMLLFDQVTTLSRSYTSNIKPDHFIIPAINEEISSFTWCDIDGEERFVISGVNTHKDDSAPPLEQYLFGCVAEKAWTRHLINLSSNALVSGKAISFPLPQSNGILSIGAKKLQYQSGNNIISWPTKETSSLFRSHEYMILTKKGEKGKSEDMEIGPIDIMGLCNERFFFSILELFTGLKMHALRTELPSKNKKHLDRVTNLPDKSLFHDRLEVALTHHQRNTNKLLVIIVELNNLVFINHTLGHKSGTVAVQTISERLKQKVRQVDTVARLEGIEFGVILSEFKSAKNIDKFLKGLKAYLEEPIEFENNVIEPDIIVGHSYYPDESDDVDFLIRKARMRTYCVKYRDLFHLKVARGKQCK
ncbi:MAG: GGDEF domain-containing protein [Magnetococcales bacterium]|nr:GGDEF domain-containing protein [Magnetococcales bacterium]